MAKRRETLSSYRDEEGGDSRSAARPEGGRNTASLVTMVLASRRAARICVPGHESRRRPTHGNAAGAYILSIMAVCERVTAGCAGQCGSRRECAACGTEVLYVGCAGDSTACLSSGTRAWAQQTRCPKNYILLRDDKERIYQYKTQAIETCNRGGGIYKIYAE